jgi:hypothetical protein
MRTTIKRALARTAFARRTALGTTVLIYHRIGGGSPDERDLSVGDFRAQLDALEGHPLIDIDTAARRLRAGDNAPGIVLTFDDGFADVYENAWPMMRSRRIPFTLYLSTAYVGGTMHWDGSTAKAAGPALTWGQIEEMAESRLCTVANHTHNHARPERLTEAELDECDSLIESRLGARPRHFAYPWGIPVPEMEPALRGRYRSAVTGELGRNLPGTDPMRMRRVPVRRTDPIEFFRAKLVGGLGPERTYAAVVSLAKKAGAHA